MDCTRKKPECMKILKSTISLGEAIDTAFFAYKEFAKKGGRNYGFLDIRKGSGKKYYKHFMNLLINVCSLLHYINPEIRLNKLKLIKVCLDYYDALQQSYTNRGIGHFMINQLATVYAMEVYQQWCIDNYITLDRYVEEALKPKRIVVKEDTNGIIKKQKIPKFRKAFKKGASGVYELDI